jgi:anaerobic selenocysteine-containing dehydrogenase
MGQVKPNHYFEAVRALWRNRDQLPFTWRILRDGVCDGCALGTSGLSDFTMDGIHLCMTRLNLLRMNTMPGLDVSCLADAGALKAKSGAELRELGRLPYPMVRKRGEAGFRRIGWEEAFALASERIRAAAPRRLAFYLTSRGMTNEVYYVAQKAARFLGTNNVDYSARICHAPSSIALKQSMGVAASTCSYRDWLGTDLLVFIGSNVPNNQPVTTKYIYLAKKEGTRVAVIIESEAGELRRRVKIIPIRPRNVQVFWPEGNVLIKRGHRDPRSGVPDYNAMVRITPVLLAGGGASAGGGAAAPGGRPES